jgi:four helix bundle protein
MNVKTQMLKKDTNKIYDLEERTAKFGEEIIRFVKSIKKDTITNPLISQIVRSATSVGANYVEADGAESKKDFMHKISICKKEAKETKHWLRMISTACPESKIKCRELWKECQELTLIFSSIVLSKKEKIKMTKFMSD